MTTLDSTITNESIEIQTPSQTRSGRTYGQPSHHEHDSSFELASTRSVTVTNTNTDNDTSTTTADETASTHPSNDPAPEPVFISQIISPKFDPVFSSAHCNNPASYNRANLSKSEIISLLSHACEKYKLCAQAFRHETARREAFEQQLAEMIDKGEEVMIGEGPIRLGEGSIRVMGGIREAEGKAKWAAKETMEWVGVVRLIDEMTKIRAEEEGW